jgi:hypothetical protein
MALSANYRICGLAVSSDIELPGAIHYRSDAQKADVCIHRAPVPMRLNKAIETGPTWEMTNENFLLRVPRLARLMITAGRDIAVELEVGATEHDVTGFILGTAFGVLLHQRGLLVLHGSAVAQNGRALAICGESGAGKSTLAAALCRAGFSFVTDDLCVVSQNEHKHPVVLPDGRKLKLWREAIENLDLAERQGEAVRQSFEKYYIEPVDTASDPPALSAVFVLREARPPDEEGIECLALPDAMRTLECEMYRPGIRERMGLKPELIAHAAVTLSHARVFLLRRRRGFEHLDRTVAQVRARFDSLDR